MLVMRDFFLRRSCLFWVLVALCVGSFGCEQKEDSEQGENTEKGGEEVGGWKTSEWLMTRGGKQLQGRVRDKSPDQPKVLWTFEMESPGRAEAAIGDGVIYVGDAIGNVYAIDMEAQEARWKFVTDGSVLAAPALSPEVVVVASSDAMVYGLDRESGEKRWAFEGEDKFTAGPIIQKSSDGKEEWVLVNCYDGTSHCLRLRDGTTVWDYNTGYYLNGASAVLDDTLVVFGGCDAMVYGLDLSSGEPALQVETEAQITNSGATAGSVMYCGNHAHQVVAADVLSEEILWVYEGGEFPFEAAPALNDDTVYIGGGDKNLHAISRKTGEGTWKFRTGGRVEGAPLAFDDAVVFGSKDGRLYGVNAADGTERWRLDLGEGLVASPAFANGQIVIAGDDGTVFVVGE